jgi:hypothetical protein
MGMITQDKGEMQEAVSDILRSIPIALTNESGCVYILVKDLAPDLEKFILTGIAETDEFQVFPDAVMHGMAIDWEQSGLKVEYRSQRMEYMHRTVTIVCPRISNKGTGMNVSLIPWFTLPGRPYPVFVYMYAIWHYNVSEKKSQRLSAEAAGKVFGIGSFNKSTVCRNSKAMAGLSESIRGAGAASAETASTKSTEEVMEHIPKILKGCPSIETLKEILGGNVGSVPESVNKTRNPVQALSGMPQEYSNVIIETEHAGNRRRDTRKRPSRPRKHPKTGVQRNLRFADSAMIERIRRDFIASCRDMVMDSAAVYHKLLL